MPTKDNIPCNIKEKSTTSCATPAAVTKKLKLIGVKRKRSKKKKDLLFINNTTIIHTKRNRGAPAQRKQQQQTSDHVSVSVSGGLPSFVSKGRLQEILQQEQQQQQQNAQQQQQKDDHKEDFVPFCDTLLAIQSLLTSAATQTTTTTTRSPPQQQSSSCLSIPLTFSLLPVPCIFESQIYEVLQNDHDDSEDKIVAKELGDLFRQNVLKRLESPRNNIASTKRRSSQQQKDGQHVSLLLQTSDYIRGVWDAHDYYMNNNDFTKSNNNNIINSITNWFVHHLSKGSWITSKTSILTMEALQRAYDNHHTHDIIRYNKLTTPSTSNNDRDVATTIISLPVILQQLKEMQVLLPIPNKANYGNLSSSSSWQLWLPQWGNVLGMFQQLCHHCMLRVKKTYRKELSEKSWNSFILSVQEKLHRRQQQQTKETKDASAVLHHYYHDSNLIPPKLIIDYLRNSMAIQFASDTQQQQQHDKVMHHQQHWMRQVFENAWALKDAPADIRANKRVVVAAIQQVGMTLGCASDSLRNDKEVVLIAIKHDWRALKQASSELQNNKEVVLAAVQQDKQALQFASRELKKDKGLALAAIKYFPDAIKYLHEDLKRDPELLIAVGMFDKNHHETTTIPPSKPFTTTIIKKIALSTRFSLNPSSHSEATNFTKLFKDHWYIRTGNFKVYAPNAFEKKTCDPNWTDFHHPCRGTVETCQFGMSLKTGHPTNESCWRYSFRCQLEEAKKTGGFMLQLVENMGMLGKGQRIELDMAQELQLKVFQVYRSRHFYKLEDEFEMHHIDNVIAAIKQWYNEGCQDMSECIVYQDSNKEACTIS